METESLDGESDGECEESNNIAVSQANRARLMFDGEYTETSSLYFEILYLRAVNKRQLKQYALQDRYISAIKTRLHVANLSADPEVLKKCSPMCIREVLKLNEQTGIQLKNALMQAEESATAARNLSYP